MQDLFGIEVKEATLPTAPGVNKRKPTPAKGFAAHPGSGPDGEKCKTCLHYRQTGRGGKFKKCDLQRWRWTHGPGSDIKANSPACSKWEKPFPASNQGAGIPTTTKGQTQ